MHLFILNDIFIIQQINKILCSTVYNEFMFTHQRRTTHAHLQYI